MQNYWALMQQRVYLRMEHLQGFIMEHPFIMSIGVTLSVLGSLLLLAVLGAPVPVMIIVPVILLLASTVGLAAFMDYVTFGVHDENLHARLLREQQRARLRRRHPELANTPDSLIDSLYHI